MRLEVVALAAYRHVCLGATDQFLVLVVDRAQRERGGQETQFTDRMQLLNFLCLRYKFKDRVEALALVCGSECAHDHNFALMRCHFNKIYNLQILE